MFFLKRKHNNRKTIYPIRIDKEANKYMGGGAWLTGTETIFGFRRFFHFYWRREM